MRLLKLFLLVLLVILQYRLWLGKNSLPEYWHLQEDVARQEQSNQKLRQRNQVLVADIQDLREGEVALEERARNELGLIKQDETFFRLIATKPKNYDDN